MFREAIRQFSPPPEECAASVVHVGNLRVDSTGNLYVLDGSTILKFAPGAKGNVAPIATISSSAFTFVGGPIAVQ
jgi:hypothetical protein